MAIVINGSGTVTGISVGGLPDGIVDSGTLATNSVDSAELIDGAVDNSHIDAMAASKLTGALPAISGASLTGLTSAQMPTGSVIQVVSTTTTTKTSTSSTSYVDTAITADITPSSASNKVMVLATIAGITAPSSLSSVCFGLFRDSSEIAKNTNFLYNQTAPANAEFSMSTLDSPSSTSSLTYLVKFKNRQVANIDVNTYYLDCSTITLMEIAG